MKFGPWLRELRKADHQSQRDLADRMNLPALTITSWEMGKSTPHPDLLPALATALRVDIKHLLTRDDWLLVDMERRYQHEQQQRRGTAGGEEGR